MSLLVKQIESLSTIDDKLSYLCNVSAVVKEELLDTNWVGFYLYKDGQLHLGPFQGKIACTLINIGQGVCGTAFQRKMLLNINDVHRFEGHIACDNASNSEIVIPMIYDNKCIGVLDIDSTSYGRFSSDDEEILETIAKLVAEKMCK